MGEDTRAQSHFDDVVEVVSHVVQHASELSGFRITQEPAQLRHFTAAFAPLSADAPAFATA